MTRFLLLTAAFCVAFSAAVADQTYRWNAETYVTIQPSHRAGVAAEVHFVNTGIHADPYYSFDLDLDGMLVTVLVEINTSGADDTMTVTPPSGFIASPPEVTVPEGGAGTILILLEAVS